MGKGVTARTMADLLAQAKDPTEAARIQRAIGAGRNQILYHGTHTDFPAVDPAKVDLGLHVGTSEQATNRLTDLAKAMRGTDKYNTGAQIMPVAVRLGNSLNMRDVGGWESALEAGLALRKHPELEARQSEIDELLDSVDDMQRAFVAANQHMDDPAKAWLTSDDNRRALRDMRDLLVSDGYDSIKYRNEVENTHGQMGGLFPEYEKEASDIDARMREIKQAAIQRRPAVPNASDPNYPALLQDFLDRSPVLENFMTAEEKDLLQKYGSRYHDLRTSDQYRNSPYSHIILKPENLRSINAQFDPEFDLSDDLMKAEGGLVEDLPKFGKGQLFRSPKLSELIKETRNNAGNFRAQRIERAADEIPMLDTRYSIPALDRAFNGETIEMMTTMNPADFEKYALPLRRVDQQHIDKLRGIVGVSGSGGFNDVPYLSIRQPPPEELPMIFGHEGRHRSRALAGLGDDASLVRIRPGGLMKESLPRHTAEEFFDAFKQKHGSLLYVVPEEYGGDIRAPYQLPELYADGGLVELANKYANGNTLQKFGKGQLFRTIQGGVSDAAKKSADALDMSQAARMQRANEFGGEANWYRGSAIDEGDELSKKFLGENTNAPSARRGFFFASNPETASSPSYATMSGDVINDYVQSRFKQLTGRNNTPEDENEAWKYLAEEATKPIVDEKFKKGFDALYNTDYQLKNELEEILIGHIKKLAESDDEYYLNQYSNYINELMRHRDDGAGEISDELKRMVFENIPEIERVTAAISERDNIYDALKASSRLDPKWVRGSEGAPDSIFDNAELGANVGQYKLNMQNPYIHDMGGSGYRETSYDEILANALSGGHDSAIIKNTYDGGKQLTDIGVIFEPNQARSIYADFNPAKRSSANLSAGIVGGAVGLSTLGNSGEYDPLDPDITKRSGGLVDLARKYNKGGLIQKYQKGNLVRQWLKGYPEKSLAPLKRADDKKAETAALNNWIDTSLAKYIKRDYGSPNDPLAALAREQRHVPLREGVLGEAQAAYVWPPKQFGTQAGLIPYVKYTQPRYLDDRDASILAENPWISSLAPDTPLYRDVDTNELGIAHLRDELYNAIRPDSDLPDQLRLQPESLPRVSVAQASQLVGKINAWRAAESAKAELAASMNPATFIHKEYPEKNMRWVEIRPKDKLTKLPDGYSLGPSNDMSRQSGRFVLYHPDGKESALGSYSSEEEALKKALRVIGDDGGYQNIKDALKYESDHMHHCIGNPDSGYCDDVFDGLSRVFSLRDRRGAPHVTIETSGSKSDEWLSGEAIDEASPGTFDDYLEQRSKYDGIASLHDYVKTARPDVYEMLTRPEIRQIKGHGDRMPVDRYLPFVQDFVKSQKWANVKDLHHTGMRRSADAFQPYSLTKARAEGIDLPDYLTEQEIADITAKLRAINKPAGMKEGGMARPDVRDNPDNESYEESKRRKKTGIDMLDSALDPLYAIRAGIRAQYRPQDVVWTDDEGNRHSYTAPGLSNSTVGLGMFLPGENPMSDAAMDAYTSGLNYENEMAGLPSSELMNKYTHFGNTLGEVLGQLPIGPAVVGRGMLSKAAMAIPDYLGPFMRPSVGNYAGAAMAGEALPHLIGGMMSLAEKYGLGSDTPIDADESDRLLASLGIESAGNKIAGNAFARARDASLASDRYATLEAAKEVAHEASERAAARERMASMVYGSLPRYEKGQLVKGVKKFGRSTIKGAERKAYPGIYRDPKELVAEASLQVPLESPALQQLFGVSRLDLADMALGREATKWLPPGAPSRGRGSAHAAPVMHDANTER
jgi:hypothetical protein